MIVSKCVTWEVRGNPCAVCAALCMQNNKALHPCLGGGDTFSHPPARPQAA